MIYRILIGQALQVPAHITATDRVTALDLLNDIKKISMILMLEIRDKPVPSTCSVLAKLQNRQYLVLSVVIFFGFAVIRQVDIAFLWKLLEADRKATDWQGFK